MVNLQVNVSGLCYSRRECRLVYFYLNHGGLGAVCQIARVEDHLEIQKSTWIEMEGHILHVSHQVDSTVELEGVGKREFQLWSACMAEY